MFKYYYKEQNLTTVRQVLY